MVVKLRVKSPASKPPVDSRNTLVPKSTALWLLRTRQARMPLDLDLDNPLPANPLFNGQPVRRSTQPPGQSRFARGRIRSASVSARTCAHQRTPPLSRSGSKLPLADMPGTRQNRRPEGHAHGHYLTLLFEWPYLDNAVGNGAGDTRDLFDRLCHVGSIYQCETGDR